VLADLEQTGIRVALEDVDVSEADFATLARDADLVIGHSLSGEVPRGAEGLHRTVLAREPLDVALPAGHRLARGRRALKAAQLVHERWVAVPPGYPFGTVLDRVRRQTGAELEVVQQVRDNRLVEALVTAGVGIAVLPRYTTRRRPGLTLRPLADVDAERWVVGMSRPDRARRAVVRELVERLARVGDEVRRRG
jgi:DNA-binding transcriptional LysR family regulator